MSAYTNFHNGALVMRIWRFDGGSELLAKFAYYDHAKEFARLMVKRDEERGANVDDRWFFLAVCEAENQSQAFSHGKPDGGA
jgi:hypothetical protein